MNLKLIVSSQELLRLVKDVQSLLQLEKLSQIMDKRIEATRKLIWVHVPGQLTAELGKVSVSLRMCFVGISTQK